MHVEDVTDKKETSHKAHHSMKQSNVVFTDPKVFDQVDQKFTGHRGNLAMKKLKI